MSGVSAANTPPTPPAKARGNLDDARTRTIIELLLLGRPLEAEARLRELNAARRHGLQHRHKFQIERIESYFRQHAGRDPWPANFQPGQLIHFREVLGGLLDTVPLKLLLEDLKAECGDKQSLLYFLSTEQGKRASRWEMLAVDCRERQIEAERQKFRREAVLAYERIFGAEGPVKPSWVVKLEDEAKQIRHLIPLTTNEGSLAEMRQRLGFIRTRLEHWEHIQNGKQTPGSAAR